MQDIDDHLEDVNEENDELRHAVEEVLEEQTGIEWDAANVNDREDMNEIHVQVEPTGSTRALAEKFGREVGFSGQLNLTFPK